MAPDSHRTGDVPGTAQPGTIGELLSRLARERTTACAYIDDDAHWSWAAVDTASDQLACGLLGLGLVRGERIGILAPNGMEWLLLFYAAAKLGVGVVGLSVRYRDTELGHMLADGLVQVVFTTGAHEGCDFVALLARLAPGLPRLRHVVVLPDMGAPALTQPTRHAARPLAGHGTATAASPSLVSMQSLAAAPLDRPRLAAARAAVAPGDLAMVIYTSGTTGQPKGAGLTHRSMLASARAQAAHMRIAPGDLVHLALPLNHVGGITCGALAQWVGGGCTVLLPEFKAGLMLELMARHRPTIVSGVPTMLALMLLHPAVEQVDFSGVRLVFSGGANVDPVLLERLAQRLPQATLMNIYGLSETSGGIVMTPWDCSTHDRLHSIGKPFADAELRIAGVDGQALPPGEVGELWFRGGGVVPGYTGAAAGQGFSADGWLMTGDLGQVDERGLITLKGRKKDMYIQGGFNVYPAEVESLLNRHPQVLMCAVIGVPDPLLGEVGHACVVPHTGKALTAGDLRQWCAENLADYKVPRQVSFHDALPMTPAGKIHKAALRDALAK